MLKEWLPCEVMWMLQTKQMNFEPSPKRLNMIVQQYDWQH